MNKLIFAAAAVAALASTASAGGTSVAAAADNYVQRDMIWDQDAQSTRPTLIVAVNGTVTRYDVGDLGLTRDTIMREDGLHAVDWVKNALGQDVKHLMYSSDHFGG